MEKQLTSYRVCKALPNSPGQGRASPAINESRTSFFIYQPSVPGFVSQGYLYNNPGLLSFPCLCWCSALLLIPGSPGCYIIKNHPVSPHRLTQTLLCDCKGLAVISSCAGKAQREEKRLLPPAFTLTCVRAARQENNSLPFPDKAPKAAGNGPPAPVHMVFPRPEGWACPRLLALPQVWH